MSLEYLKVNSKISKLTRLITMDSMAKGKREMVAIDRVVVTGVGMSVALSQPLPTWWPRVEAASRLEGQKIPRKRGGAG